MSTIEKKKPSVNDSRSESEFSDFPSFKNDSKSNSSFSKPFSNKKEPQYKNYNEVMKGNYFGNDSKSNHNSTSYIDHSNDQFPEMDSLTDNSRIQKMKPQVSKHSNKKISDNDFPDLAEDQNKNHSN